jgi:hypothetical protein
MTEDTEPTAEGPWPQRLLDNLWVLAGAAIVFWALSYLVWGFLDILAVGGS